MGNDKDNDKIQPAALMIAMAGFDLQIKRKALIKLLSERIYIC